MAEQSIHRAVYNPKDGGTPNDRNRYEVTRDDLPLPCPLPSKSLWNSHPRVYLPIEETGQAKCPYCGAEFVLVDQQDQSR